jgi:hypothetical protein
LIGLGIVVLAFMGLSLVITATGAARFAVAMGYPAQVGYTVGVTFDVAKDILLVSLLVLRAQRAFGFCAIIGSAWLCLVTFSCLATEATVSTAIDAIERNGTWKMEGRSNIKAELGDIEQQLNRLSQPTPPRHSKTLTEALSAEKVPPVVWRDSQECKSIHESKYFQTACTKVLGLRQELANAEQYEKLAGHAQELRHALAAAPIVATSDALPEAFSATLGRLIPIEGRTGVSLLVAGVIEIMSCFGLATLRRLSEEGREGAGEGDAQRKERRREGQSVPPSSAQGEASGRLPEQVANLPTMQTEGPRQVIPPLSLDPAKTGLSPPLSDGDEQFRPPSNVVPLVRSKPREARVREASGTSPQGGTISVMSSHVAEFVRECLKSSTGSSLSAAELRSAYEGWCAKRGLPPLSRQKLGADLTNLGYSKWKSCGLMRYRDLQLGA